MPTVSNRGVQLHYQLAGNPAGPPLLLHHGFGQTLYSWHMGGYVKGLGDRHRLILFDARGHGQSDKPHEAAAYSLANCVSDVLALLDQLQLERSHFFGYSRGGRIGFALAQVAPQRLQRLVIGGATPDAVADLAAFVGVDGRDPARFITAFEALIGESLSPLARQFVLANDLLALAAAAQPEAPGQALAQTQTQRQNQAQANSFAIDLASLQLPILLFAGQGDRRLRQIQACAQLLPQAQLEILPGLNHGAAIAQGQAILPRLRTFLAEP